jgi:hypothetical protein
MTRSARHNHPNGGDDTHSMADVVLYASKKNIASGTIDLNSDTIKMMLVTASYTPDQDTTPSA